MRGYLFVAVWLHLPFTASGADMTSEDPTPEIVDRCIAQMGEFGVEAVRICVDQDLAAAKALEQYPREARAAVARCTQQMRKGGWWMVKSCVDRDIEAAAALAKYPEAHAAVLERCETKVGEHGAAQVKACVDHAIGGQ